MIQQHARHWKSHVNLLGHERRELNMRQPGAGHLVCMRGSHHCVDGAQRAGITDDPGLLFVCGNQMARQGTCGTSPRGGGRVNYFGPLRSTSVNSEPWLSKLSKLSELSDYYRTTIGVHYRNYRTRAQCEVVNYYPVPVVSRVSALCGVSRYCNRECGTDEAGSLRLCVSTACRHHNPHPYSATSASSPKLTDEFHFASSVQRSPVGISSRRTWAIAIATRWAVLAPR